MIKKLIILFALLPLSFSVLAAQGMVNIKSSHSVTDTANKLEKVLKSKGMTIFNRVKHSQAAKNAGIDINPTELIIFGNPKIGSKLMQCAATVAIDLPQKTLIWQDENQQVWISYNDPIYLKKRHSIEGCDVILHKVSGALSKLSGAAAK